MNTPQLTLSSGARRAAAIILSNAGLVSKSRLRRVAMIIERETGHAELYAALEYALPFVRNCKYEHMGDTTGAESDKTTAIQKVTAALAMARGES